MTTGGYDDREGIDMPIFRNKDPKPRYSSPQQAGLKAITDAEAEALTQMADFNTQLGINSDQGAFEASYVHLNSGEKGTPRVFFTVPGQDGVEGIKNLHETGMQNWWGKDFWNQVQMGNVFVYPARSDKPCQLQLGKDDQGNWQLSVSRPLEAGEIPQRVAPKPNGWQRFWNRIYSGFYKDVCQIYDNREKSAEAVKNNVSQMNDRRKETDKSKEADVVTKEADRKRQTELDEARRQEIAPVSTAAGNLRRNTDFAKKLYGMEPPKTGLRPFGINAKGSKEETLYNARQKKITDEYAYDHGFEKIKSEDFGALAYFNTEDVMKVTETLAQPQHGGAEGAKLVQENVYKGRDKVSDAFKDLKKQQKYDGMVYSIRDGVKNAVDMFTNKQFPGGKFTEAQKTAMAMGADLSKFMDKVKKDEYLYPAVEKQIGGEKVWNKNQDVLKGFEAFQELDKRRTSAKMNLIESQYDVNDKTTEFDKKNLMKDIIKADIAEKIMTGELAQGKTGFTRGLPGYEWNLTQMAEQVIEKAAKLDPKLGGADLVKNLDKHDYDKSIADLVNQLAPKEEAVQNSNVLQKQNEAEPLQAGF